jgi:hypothetical protein
LIRSFTSVHGHRGLGTKFFTYGNGKGSSGHGQFIQDLLSAGDDACGADRV